MALATVAAQALGTLVVATAFYALTLHLAATFVLEEARPLDALVVAPAPAVLSLAVGLLSEATDPLVAPLLGPVLAIPVDFLAIRWSYDLETRTAALVTVGHFVTSVLLAASLIGILTA